MADYRCSKCGTVLHGLPYTGKWYRGTCDPNCDHSRLYANEVSRHECKMVLQQEDKRYARFQSKLDSWLDAPSRKKLRRKGK